MFTFVSSDCPLDRPFAGDGKACSESLLMKERSGPESSPSLRGVVTVELWAGAVARALFQMRAAVPMLSGL